MNFLSWWPLHISILALYISFTGSVFKVTAVRYSLHFTNLSEETVEVVEIKFDILQYRLGLTSKSRYAYSTSVGVPTLKSYQKQALKKVCRERSPSKNNVFAFYFLNLEGEGE